MAVLLSFFPHMILILTWILDRTAQYASMHIVYENAFIIPAWITGVLTMIPGFLAMYTNNPSRRNMLLNVWTVFLGIFMIAIICSGVFFVYTMATDKKLVGDAIDFGGKAIQQRFPGKKAPAELSDLGSRLSGLAKTAVAHAIYTHLPYPYSAIFFLHWQIGVTAVGFCVLPALLSMWGFYHGLGNRNYFATNPKPFDDGRIVDGPYESDYESEESDSSDAGERAPLKYAHKNENASIVTEIQEDRDIRKTRKGKQTRV